MSHWEFWFPCGKSVHFDWTSLGFRNLGLLSSISINKNNWEKRSTIVSFPSFIQSLSSTSCYHLHHHRYFPRYLLCPLCYHRNHHTSSFFIWSTFFVLQNLHFRLPFSPSSLLFSPCLSSVLFTFLDPFIGNVHQHLLCILLLLICSCRRRLLPLLCRRRHRRCLHRLLLLLFHIPPLPILLHLLLLFHRLLLLITPLLILFTVTLLPFLISSLLILCKFSVTLLIPTYIPGNTFVLSNKILLNKEATINHSKLIKYTKIEYFCVMKIHLC